MSDPCSFGYEEYDGARYCFAHGGFLEAGLRTRLCDRAPEPPPLRRAEEVIRIAEVHR